MNKHIELVKKWLAEPASVSLEELKDDKAAAWSDWYAVYWSNWDDVKDVETAWATYRATSAAYWAATDAVYRRNCASEYVKQYEELTK